MIELITIYFHNICVYTVLGEFKQVLKLIPPRYIAHFTWKRKSTQIRQIYSTAKLSELACRINSIVRHVLQKQRCENKATSMFISWYNIDERS